MFRLILRPIHRIVANVHVGKPQGVQDASAHTAGVRSGNSRGNFQRERGLHADRDGAHCSARRSTGINPEGREPIDPRMPNLTPS